MVLITFENLTMATSRPSDTLAAQNQQQDILKENIKEQNKKEKTQPITPSSDKAKQDLADSLSLTASNGKKIELTSSKLEQWFASIEARNLQESTAKNNYVAQLPNKEVMPSYLATQFLGRYGLKSAQDVITFLKSPAGTSVRSMISEQLAEIAALKEIQQQRELDEQTRRHRLLAFLLLGLLYHRAQAERLHDMYEKDADKSLQRAKTVAEHANAVSQEQESLSQAYASYEQSVKAIQSQLENKLHESQEIENKLAALEQKEQEILIRYEAFDNHLDQIDEHLDKALSENLGHEEVKTALESRISQLQQQLSAKDNEMNSLKARNKHSIAQQVLSEKQDLHTQLRDLQDRLSSHQKQKSSLKLNKIDRIAVIENKIEQLTETLEKQLDEIDGLLETGKKENEEKAMQLLQEHNGLHAEIQGLKDMVAVLQGKKGLYTISKDGNSLEEAHSFKDAEFILPKEPTKQPRIVKHEGKYYLLDPNQTFNPDDKEGLAKAQQNYERARPNISTLKKLVVDNKGTEIKLHHEKKKELSTRGENLQKEIQLLKNQLVNIQAAKASVETRMNNTPIPGIELTPIPTPSPTNTTNTPPKYSSQTYKMIVDELKAMALKPPTDASIQQFKKDLKAFDKETYKAMEKEIGQKIKAGMPILEQTMKSLLANIERFAVPADKPNVVSTPNPFSTQLKPKPSGY